MRVDEVILRALICGGSGLGKFDIQRCLRNQNYIVTKRCNLYQRYSSNSVQDMNIR